MHNFPSVKKVDSSFCFSGSTKFLFLPPTQRRETSAFRLRSTSFAETLSQSLRPDTIYAFYRMAHPASSKLFGESLKDETAQSASLKTFKRCAR
jgi:hypothetical protein